MPELYIIGILKYIIALSIIILTSALVLSIALISISLTLLVKVITTLGVSE